MEGDSRGTNNRLLGAKPPIFPYISPGIPLHAQQPIKLLQSISSWMNLPYQLAWFFKAKSYRGEILSELTVHLLLQTAVATAAAKVPIGYPIGTPGPWYSNGNPRDPKDPIFLLKGISRGLQKAF